MNLHRTGRNVPTRRPFFHCLITNCNIELMSSPAIGVLTVKMTWNLRQGTTTKSPAGLVSMLHEIISACLMKTLCINKAIGWNGLGLGFWSFVSSWFESFLRIVNGLHSHCLIWLLWNIYIYFWFGVPEPQPIARCPLPIAERCVTLKQSMCEIITVITSSFQSYAQRAQVEDSTIIPVFLATEKYQSVV